MTQFTSDPYSVGRQYQGKTLLRLEWAKLAQGEPVTAGNCFCPQCRAEFNRDTSKQFLTLLDRGTGNPAWDAWRGRAMSLPIWHIAASGKRSLHPGWLCPACRAEFDDEPAGLKAAWLPPGPLSALINRTHSLADWQRVASGAPTAVEEKQLWEECAQLRFLKQQEQAAAQRTHQEHLSRLEVELARLLKQGVVEGFQPLRLQLAQMTLREQETLHWESTGRKFKQRTSRGYTYWDLDEDCTLLVTSERILLDSPPHKLWQRPLAKLIKIDRQHSSEGPNIVLWLDGLQKPVGLSVAGLQLNVPVGNQTRTIQLDVADLAGLLQTLSRKEK